MADVASTSRSQGWSRSAPLLSCENLVAGYTRDIDILRDLSAKAWAGRISCVVGPNGTGKSTLLKALFGFLKPSSGRVRLGDKDITGQPPFRMLAAGLAYLPQRPSLFPHLTVETNLKLGLWHARPKKAVLAEKLERAYARFPIIREKRAQPAGQLSGGQQRQVEIARSLMTDPSIYLIDEPTAGVDPQTSELIYEIVRDLARDLGKAVLLVDQDIRAALAITDYVYVVKNGAVFSEGAREDFGSDTDALVARWLYASGE
ncbi:ABC transporter ATP-binding protein [Mesorhizobium sp.]|uniref:branched-chain amino acid ABC transporter ATP-binding protein n=1 Tax=Mesorhizobium sp. TaxID=1871066 RepID=UPI000FE5AF79|nr:ABC transporter ATP-binding protein [Mesorhizobium sp.]RWA79121.1 MAG: ABC transporter ATP-binding protein [Mesorhizobium sp.]